VAAFVKLMKGFHARESRAGLSPQI